MSVDASPSADPPANPVVPALGAWAVMGWDWNAYPISLWPDELSARRDADRRGYGDVEWWPWGAWDERKVGI